MKLYIGGKFEEKERIKDYARIAVARGHEITEPWFDTDFKDTLTVAACKDVKGVLDAELCIFIFDKDLQYSGALTEFGIAIAARKNIIIVGHAIDRNIFVNLPDIMRAESFAYVLSVYL